MLQALSLPHCRSASGDLSPRLTPICLVVHARPFWCLEGLTPSPKTWPEDLNQTKKNVCVLSCLQMLVCTISGPTEAPDAGGVGMKLVEPRKVATDHLGHVLVLDKQGLEQLGSTGPPSTLLGGELCDFTIRSDQGPYNAVLHTLWATLRHQPKTLFRRRHASAMPNRIPLRWIAMSTQCSPAQPPFAGTRM